MLSPNPGLGAGSPAPSLRGVWLALIILASVMIGATAGLLVWGALGQGVVLGLFMGAGAFGSAVGVGLNIVQFLLGRAHPS